MKIKINDGWSSDFSYAYLKRILHIIKSKFAVVLLSNAYECSNEIKVPIIILRHDIDVSLKNALKMAKIEWELGICATYMIMTNSPLYSIEDVISRQIIRKIIEMNHEIGLHFDLDVNERSENCKIELLKMRITSDCKKLEKITGSPIKSISFHRPISQLIRGPSNIAGRVNAYSNRLMDWYLSDSKGFWREGEPLPKLLNESKPLLQLLIHPVWWGDEHKSANDRLQELFDEETRDKTIDDTRRYDCDLRNVIPAVKRKGLCDNTNK